MKLYGNGEIDGLLIPPQGQCRLYSFGTNLLLKPLNGNQLFIDGKNRSIPSGGVSLPATGLPIGGLTYVYAAMSGSTMALEFSATARATDANYGHEIKNNDPTRSLVGAFHAKTATAFTDSAAQRLVLSWFNQEERGLFVNGAGIATTSQNTPAVDTGTRLEFLAWAGKGASIGFWASMYQSGPGGIGYCAPTFNTPTTAYLAETMFQAYGVNAYGSLSSMVPVIIGADSYNYSGLCFRTNGSGVVNITSHGLLGRTQG